jgi:hypothetical protein
MCVPVSLTLLNGKALRAAVHYRNAEEQIRNANTHVKEAHVP